MNEQCRLIKKYAKNQWVTTNYIPDYDKGHIGGSKDLDFVSYTRYMVYGDNEGIGRRGYRVGNPLRIAMANDFFRPVNGTYGVMELQPGQVNWEVSILNPCRVLSVCGYGAYLPEVLILSARIAIVSLCMELSSIIMVLWVQMV